MPTPKSDRLRLRKSELFEMLHYTPHRGQLLLHRSKARRRVLACGTRWGKSTCAAVETLVYLLAPRERTRGWLVAPTYDLTDRIFARVADLVEAHFSHRVRKLDRRNRLIVLRNLAGELAEMKSKSADKPTSLLGEGLDWLVVDEAARLATGVWESHLAARLVDRRGEALLLSTPRGSGWFQKEWRRGQAGRDPAYESWQSPTTDNPHIDAAVVEDERRRLAPDVFAQEFLAEFVGPEADACVRCGWPNPMARTVVVPGVNGDEEPGTCEECGGNVDKDGQTLDGRTMNGERIFTRIIFGPRIYAVPTLPGEHPDLPQVREDIARAETAADSDPANTS